MQVHPHVIRGVSLTFRPVCITNQKHFVLHSAPGSLSSSLYLSSRLGMSLDL